MEGPSGTRITFALPETAPEISIEEVAAQVQVWRLAYPGLFIDIAQGEST